MDDPAARAFDEIGAALDSAQAEVAAEPPPPYSAGPHGLRWHKPTKDGEVVVPLTNFAARIVGEVARDDGAERLLEFEIEAELRRRVRRFQIGAGEFASLGWVPRELGGEAVVYPGYAVKDHTRVAIQTLSGTIPSRSVFAHSGWRQVDGRMAYLHAGGAIDRAGPVGSVDCDLAAAGLGDVVLATPRDPIAAVRAALGLLDLGPLPILAPVVAACWRAPLGAADFTVFLAGPTGVFKTQLAALAQAHWGAGFDAGRLPGAWSSTPNALEGLAFAAKDMLLVVDDLAPGGTKEDVARSHREAARVLRAQGNNAGRRRMRPDGTLRPPKPPRGLILATGEDLPQGHSIRARCVIVEVATGEIDAGRLTACQADAAAGRYAGTMALFVQWIARDHQGRLQRFRDRREELRRPPSAGQHARTPWTVAELQAGLELFLEFAVETDALTAEEAAAKGEACAGALLRVAERQAGHQGAEDPARRFVELMGGLLASKRAHLARAQAPEREPPDHLADCWGWQARTVSIRGRAGLEDDEERTEWRPGGELIGWVEDDRVYLYPEAAYAAAQRLANTQGRVLAVEPRTLWKRLAEAGLLVATDKDKNTVKHTIGGYRKRVLALAAASILGKQGHQGREGPAGTSRPEPPSARPYPTPPSPTYGQELGRASGAQHDGAAGACHASPHRPRSSDQGNVAGDDASLPAAPCATCEGTSFHRAPGDRWRCSGCEPIRGEAAAGWAFCTVPSIPTGTVLPGVDPTGKRGGG